jgi:hypothetical protein
MRILIQAQPVTPNAPHTPSQAQALNVVIWLALTVAPLIYTYVAFIVRPSEPGLSFPDLSNSTELALTVVAIAVAFAGFVVPNIVAGQLRSQITGTGPDADLKRAEAEKVVMVIRGALFEAVAVTGFVMVFQGAPATRVVPFAAVSFVLLLLHLPTRERLSRPFQD